MAYSKDKEIDFLEFPTILWDKKYDDDPEALKAMVQHISDFMLFQGNPVFSENNPELNYDLLDGNMPKLKKLYKDVEYTFGAPGSTKIKDYKFFYNDYHSVEGLLMDVPSKPSFNNISQSYISKKIIDDSEMVAAFQRNSIIQEIAQEDGQNLEGIENESPSVPNTSRALLSRLNAPSQEEYVLTRLIQNLTERHSIEDVLLKTNRDKFAVNAQFVLIDDKDGEPKPVYVRPDQVNWISPVPVEDMDDQNIIAWSVNDYMSLENALRIYGHDLASDYTSEGLRDTIKSLRGDLNPYDIRYNPYRYNESAITYHQDYSNDRPGSMGSVNWGGMFYNPINTTEYGVNYNLLRQRLFFKVIKKDHYLIKIKGENPTTKERNKIKAGAYDRDKLTYVSVEEDYKRKPGEYMISSPREELWEATRLGHCTIIGIKKYKYQTRYENEFNRIHPPIVGKINHAESLTSIGRDFSKLYNSFMFKMEELTNIAGADDIILVDKAQRSMPLKQMIHQAKKTGFAEYDSTLVQDQSNRLAQNHLMKTSLTPSIQTILKYLEAAKVLKGTYENIIGLNQQVLGNAGQYEGLGKVNRLIQQASYITRRYYYDDYQFKKKFFQRYADITKVFYADNNRYISVAFSKEEREVIRTNKALSTFDYETYLDVGTKVLEDKQFLMGIAERGVSSGAVSIKDFIRMYYTENPKGAEAILDAGITELERSQIELRQRQAAALERKNDIEEAARLKVPIESAQIAAKSRTDVALIKEEGRRENEEFRKDLQDVSEMNDRERKILDLEIHEEKERNSARRQLLSELAQNQLDLFDAEQG